uniref:NAD(P)-binding domain-containing protein n=1 Tax=Flavobacterium sp. TaxID=239 RepID=UPI003785251E
MIQVSVIGSGNVAHHLLRAFGASSEVEVVQVFARNKTSVEIANPNIEVIEDWSLLKSVDVIIIAVSDDAIANVSEQIPLTPQLVVHTSGSVALNALN